MDVALIYDYQSNRYIVYRGFEAVLETPSHYVAIKRFEELCDQFSRVNHG